MKRLLVILVLLSASAFAQIGTTTKIRSGATLPTTCVGGDLFVKTGTSSGTYFNLAAGTCSWSLLSASGNEPYIVAAFVPGTQTNSQVFVRHVPAVAVTVPSSCTGSTLTLSAAATGSTTYTIKKNGSSVGTAVVSSSGTSGSFTCASPFSFNGTSDVLTVEGPASADATAAGFTLSLYGTR